MSQCIVPNWDLKHQRQQQVEGEEEEEAEQGDRSSHVQLNTNNINNNIHHLVPMYELSPLLYSLLHALPLSPCFILCLSYPPFFFFSFLSDGFFLIKNVSF